MARPFLVRPTHDDMKTVHKAIIIVCIALAFTLFFSRIALDPYYYSTRPREPHPESGQIYPENVKGASGVARVYLTHTEKLPYDYGEWIMMACTALFVTAYLLNRRWKVIRNGRDEIPKKLY
jgi:hypothetical protein